MADTWVREADIAEQTRVRKLAPTESEYVGRPGYERKYREDGSYTWRYRFRPNEGGRLTREASEVGEHMAPFVQADAERHAKRQAKIPKVKLKDKDGRVRYLEPGLADATARKNGWSHAWDVGGNRIEVGLEGMLWRLVAGQWEPTGRWCTSRPFGHSPRPKRGKADGSFKCSGMLRDPDWNLWEARGRKWVRL